MESHMQSTQTRIAFTPRWNVNVAKRVHGDFRLSIFIFGHEIKLVEFV